MSRLPGRRRGRQRVRVGASLTGYAGLAAVAELDDRLGLVATLDGIWGRSSGGSRGCPAGLEVVERGTGIDPPP